MKYISEKTLRNVFAAFDHSAPERRRQAADELARRQGQPEAVAVLRVALYSEADQALASEFADRLASARERCGLAKDAEPGASIDLEKLHDRLVVGDLAQKLRAIELLIWCKEPGAQALLCERAQAETEPWIRAALALALGQLETPEVLGALRGLAAASEPRVTACARSQLARLEARRPAPAEPAVPAAIAPSEPPAAGPEASDESGTLRCPMCQAAVALSRRTMGDLVQCARCGMGFRVSLERSGDEAPRLATVALPSTELLPPGPGVTARFEVLGELGRGGQGAVYRVRPRDGSRNFALKYIESAAPAGRPLLAHQDVASTLDHPNIVSVFATGTDEAEKRAFVVYEIVEGRSLSAALADGPLTVAEAVDIMFQVLAGLAHSHAQGVVHRDLKPDNILLTRDGVAKIADFGIGVLVGETDQLSRTDEPFVGTPGYAAPEQITGWGAVRASDIYAIGMTLYEMLTGRLPFPAPTLEVLLYNQVNTRPRPPSTYAPDIPPAIEKVIMECLEKSPVQRPAWAGELYDRLKVAARGVGLAVPLATSATLPEPRSITSLAGLRAARPALLFGAAVWGAPVGLSLTSAVAPLAHVIWLLLAAWMVAIVRFAQLGVRAVGSFPTFAGPGGQVIGIGGGRNFSVGALLAVGVGLCMVLPVIVTIGGEAAASRADGLWQYLVALSLIGFAFHFPLWTAWLELLLADPAATHLERGTSVLEIDGARSLSCQVDGGPTARLPCRMLVKEGGHRLVIAGEGHTQRFVLIVQGAALLRTAVTVSGGAILDRELEPVDAEHSEWHAQAAAAAATLAMVGLVALVGHLLARLFA